MRPPNERDTLFALHGTPKFLGALAATAGSPVDNTTTATVFSLASGTVVLIQALATGGYFQFSGASAMTDAHAVYLQPYQWREVVCPITKDDTTTLLSWDPVSGTDSLNVFTLS